MEDEDAVAPADGMDHDNEELVGIVDLEEMVPASSTEGSESSRGSPWPVLDMVTSDSLPSLEEHEEQFDISLPPSHSYLGSEMEAVRGSNVVGPGWSGRMLALAHSGAVFPGEPVPLLLTRSQDAARLQAQLPKDHHLALLCPDETGAALSGYGVVCEVYEAAAPGVAGVPLLAIKARATRRLRFRRMPTAKRPVSVQEYATVRELEVVVLHEGPTGSPLRPLLSRGPRPGDQLLAAWPQCALQCLDSERLWRIVEGHLSKAKRPEPREAVGRSYRAAAGLPLSAADRATLLSLECAAARLLASARRLRGGALCCASCGAELARTDQQIAMSSAGTHAHYANPGGFVHAVVTVAKARVTLRGPPSADYSWFPGYAWTTAYCGGCDAHVGWKFTSPRRHMRPRTFFGLCRNYLAPKAEAVSSAENSPLYNNESDSSEDFVAYYAEDLAEDYRRE